VVLRGVTGEIDGPEPVVRRPPFGVIVEPRLKVPLVGKDDIKSAVSRRHPS
jgi:hypothetical protein